MSKVISFRLDKTNPREARAIEVVNTLLEKGYSVRFILTEALLALDHPGPDFESGQDDHEMKAVIGKIGHLIEIVEAMKVNSVSMQKGKIEGPDLRESFLASVKHGVKPGMKVESYLETR